ncbi:hypothetical protein PR202_ga23905 [Eleusine coracana subsp. coracana]|uniref:DRBM domain-containing protein n=1 Tax=Eleusine coracana subsp. coracana TaxID=191504 RepID=A0AAV5D7H7_ELECO|nr:hypothetical protein PR202_ga23905 [Eleusine coracana subsp. coracana]
MGEEAAVERYEPGPAFEEVKEETMLDIPPTDSTEFWLIQWIKDKDLLVSDFHGKELSLKLNKDGKLGCLESSTGKSYGVVSFASQQPNATVFLPTGSETKAEAQKDPKVELQNYAQKRGVQAPLYCVIQGPPHKPLFKSKVVIAGLTFESPEEYHTQKAAERAAAELALTSVPDQLLVSSQSYKDALKKLAEKEHYPLPRYNTMVNTLNTDVPFISTVEYGGRKGSGSSPPVIGGSDMQNVMITPSSDQEIQSREPGSSVPKISTVTCHKKDDSDAVNSVGNSANRGEQETEERESAKQEAQKDPKAELIKYAQKRGVQAPLYCVIQGPPHKPLFKSKVVIAGLTFESPEEYRTRRAAETAAAEIALTSVPDQLLVSSQSYKDALKKLAEKERYPLPRYNTMVNTLNTDAPFISTVEYGGRKGSGSSPPVIGGSDMQNAMITSGEPGSSVPKISTVTCQKTDDSDAGSSKKTLAKKGYCSRQGEQTPEHNSKEDESNVGHPDVSGKTCEGPDAPGAESNTATEMPQSTPEMPPKKKLKITKQ